MKYSIFLANEQGVDNKTKIKKFSGVSFCTVLEITKLPRK